MKRLSKVFNRSSQQSPKKLPRDETQEEILMRSDESDTEKDTAAGDKTTSVDRNGSKDRLISTTSAATSLASECPLLDRETSRKLQETLFDAAASDDVDRLKDAIKEINEHSLVQNDTGKQKPRLEQPEFCDPDTGMTVLHFALDQKKLKVAEYLIESQQKPFLSASYINISKQIPPSAKTSIHMVTEVGDEALFEKLLQKLAGNDENSKFADNWLRAQLADFKNEQVVERFEYIGKRRVSAIHLAAIKGHTHLIRPLLSYGFDIDCEDSERETPLSLAVQMGNLETAKELINAKAAVNRANAYGCTPLHLAISLGRKEMVRLLTEEGKADVNLERIKSPKTPIEMAANRGELKMVKALLKTEVSLEFRHQAMMIAASKGSLDIVKCILESDKEKLLNRPDDNGNTVLHIAAGGNYMPTVEYLVSESADLNLKNHARQTVFDIAMIQPKNALLHYLLDNRKLRKEGDIKKGGFYLHVAAANGDCNKIDYLLRSGIDFYALDEHHNTFLHTAAFHKQPDVLEKFINAEDDIDTLKNSDGETPLHIAAKRGHLRCVEQLLKKKSRLDIADRNGHNPLHAALSATVISNRIVEDLVDDIKNSNLPILNDQDIQGNTVLHLAVVGKHPEILKHFVDTVDPEIENKEGDTALHVAAEFGTIEVLKAYLDLFCGSKGRGKIDHKDTKGFSALHRCASVADVDKVECMLHHGADLSLTDETGKTVLHTMVDSYAKNPTLDDKLVQVYQAIVGEATKWYCWKNDMKVPKEESREFYFTQLDAVRLLTSEMSSDGLNVLQYASLKGATKLLHGILNTPNVYRFNKNTPLRGKEGLEETNEFGSMRKKHGSKRTLLMLLRGECVHFDVTYLVPGVMPRPESNAIGNAKPKACRTAEKNSKMSCLELIINKGKEDLAVDMLIEHPFKSLVSNYWKLCRRTYEALMWIHVTFMVCFTYFVMPSNAWLHWRFGTNSSTASPDEYISDTSGSYPRRLFGIFLLWPAFNLFYSFVYCVAFLLRAETLKDLLGGGLITKLKIGEITSGLLQIPIGMLLFVFDNLSQISSVAFGASYIAWYVMFLYADNAHRYLECLAMSFIFGWLHTVSFVKGFKDWNAMAAILKQILLKDITRFIYIYIFILISFGYAIHAIIQADYHLDPDYRSPTSTIYLTFYRMLSPGNILDVSESEDYKRSGGSVAVLRAVCSAYSVLSTVVLMNMLIAMMNSTYSDVKSMKSAAWRTESVRMALWIERHFPLRKLQLLTLKGTINDNSQNRWYMKYNPEDGREVWGSVEEIGQDSENEEHPDEEDEDAKSQPVISMADIKAEISDLRKKLQEKDKAESDLQQCMHELKKQVQSIHELCRESSQLARITRAEVPK